jgi:ABC-type bacteriocin/lantibiotic exporter with double-glycine peptidase domain
MSLFLRSWFSSYDWSTFHRLWKQAFGGRSSAYPCVRQFDEEDCGAACIATVASCHGSSLKLGHVRDAVGTTSTGTSLLGLRRGAEALGFNARAAKASPELLDDLNSITLPLVCHWNGNHWVVLHQRKGDKLVVADPAVGLIEYSIPDFLLHWNDGVILLLEPDPARLGRTSHHSEGLRVFRHYLVPFRPLLTQAISLNALIGIFGLGMPLLMQVLTDDVLLRGDNGMLASLSIGLMLLFGFRSLLNLFQGHMVGYFGQKLQLQMVMHYGQRLLGLPIRYFESHRSGEVVSRISDIQHLNSLMTQVVLGLPSQMCIAIVSLFFMWAYNPALTLAALVCYLIVLVSNLCFLPAQQKLSRQLLVKSADNQGFLVELFRGISVLKTSEATVQAWEEYQRNFGRLAHMSWSALRLDLQESTITGLLGSVTSIALLWYGSSFVINQQLSIGQLLAFNGMGANVLGFLAGLSGISQEILRADVVIKRMADVLEREPEAAANANKHSVTLTGHDDLVCDQVTFHHPGRRPLLDALSLRIPGGLTTALIGESGCGKSTITKLIAGLYPLQQGSIHYGPYSSIDLDIDSLRRQVVLVPQDSIMFNRSIYDNFSFAHPHIDFSQVVEACRLALADDFIRELPEGYQTILGEFGANLSGGQRQRLAIARALIGRPSILILDESTSALDPVLESKLMDNLLGNRQGLTTLLISHRPSVIMRSDWIIYLERGRVKEQNYPSALRESSHVSPFLVAA